MIILPSVFIEYANAPKLVLTWNFWTFSEFSLVVYFSIVLPGADRESRTRNDPGWCEDWFKIVSASLPEIFPWYHLWLVGPDDGSVNGFLSNSWKKVVYKYVGGPTFEKELQKPLNYCNTEVSGCHLTTEVSLVVFLVVALRT